MGFFVVLGVGVVVVVFTLTVADALVSFVVVVAVVVAVVLSALLEVVLTGVVKFIERVETIVGMTLLLAVLLVVKGIDLILPHTNKRRNLLVGRPAKYCRYDISLYKS